MANKYEIRIESILGGISDYENFGASDQFPFSCGIDPDINCTIHNYTTDHIPKKSSGYLVPRVQYSHASTSAFPMWLVTTPKNNDIFVYDSGGTIYTTRVYNEYATEVTTLASSVGGGSAYYDNYVYFATNSTVARFGPLNQDSPAINADYWGNSLGKTTLSSIAYPANDNCYYPNHVMHRHSNGKLYFADVVGNQGVLHCISTTKTTVEGDTDSGSTYNAIDFPPGMWPTAIASYGTNLAVALYEGNINQFNKQKAILAFWDTTNPDNYYQITSTEFPDTFISAMINSNGVLYVFSGPNPNIINTDPFVFASPDTILSNMYTRVSRFVGGYTFEQIAFIPGSIPPLASGVDAMLNKIIFNGISDGFSFWNDSGTEYDGGSNGSIFAIGSKLSGVSKTLNNIVAPENNDVIGLSSFGALKYVHDGFLDDGIYFGVKTSDDIETTRYEIRSTESITAHNNFAPCSPHWRSQTYRIGKPFKITKISLNVPTGDSQQIYVNILCDDNYFNYQKGIFNKGISVNDSYIPIRFENAIGTHNFCITLTWDVSGEWFPVDVALPIIIEYELLDNY